MVKGARFNSYRGQIVRHFASQGISSEKGARAVRAVSMCTDHFFFPLVLFSAPHHYLPLPCGEPVCRGCRIGRQARLRWLSRDFVVQILILIRIHHPQARHLRPSMKRKRRLPRSRRHDNRNAK